MKTSKAQMIVKHIQENPGLTNPAIASLAAGCSFAYAKRIFAYLVDTGNVEKEINYDGRTIYFYIGL